MKKTRHLKRILIVLSGLFTFFILAGLLFACEEVKDKQLPDEPVPIELNALQTELVHADNTFGFDLFKRLLEEETDPDKNIMISPMSIAYALSMAYNGADGNTAAEMAGVLNCPDVLLTDFNQGYKDLTQELLNVDQRVELNIANSVWSEENFPVKQTYIDVLTEYFLAESQAFDIDNPNAHEAVNEWIENETNGKIQEMLTELDPATVMLLVNAVYFKAKWKSEFDPEETIDQAFYREDGSSYMHPMMVQETDLARLSQEKFELVELPYGQGNFSFVAMVPKNEYKVDDLLPLISQESLNAWMGQISNPVETRIYMPRFTYGYKEELSAYLKNMGMVDAFSGAADFSKISDWSIFISFILHQSFIEVNEEGTEAAAATVIGFEATSLPNEPYTIRLDKPFLYFIRETTTNSILFMGRLAEPEWEE